MSDIINSNILATLIAILLGTFLLTYYLIPKIINVVNHKKLMDFPNERSSHIKLTPTFGGASFFMILVLVLLIIQEFDQDNLSLNIIAGLTVLLFIGLKDDLVIISPRSKLLGQLFASFVFLYNTDFGNINLHGFFGVYEVGAYVGILLAILVMLAIINAFNMIDGIDGLAAGIGMISLCIYSVIFYSLGNYFLVSICVALVGSLIAFLRFNLSSKRKIFMGDTGSLIIGFVAAIMTMKFLTLDANSLKQLTFIPQNSIFVVCSILVFPLLDTLRILIVRINNKKHPLLADRNHIHHVLLDLGNSHIKASLIISSFTLIFSVGFIYLTTQITNLWLITCIFFFSFFLFIGIFFKLSLTKK